MGKSTTKSAGRTTYRRKPRKICRVCGLNGAETFNFMRRSFVFDVDTARVITRDGRRPVILDRSDVVFAVDTSRIYIEHVPHVRTRFPGIIARVRCTKQDGTVVEGDLLIDGHHRAAKCLQLGRPFLCYKLTADETDTVLKTRPDQPAPPAKAAAGRRVAKRQRRGAVAKRRATTPRRRARS